MKIDYLKLARKNRNIAVAALANCKTRRPLNQPVCNRLVTEIDAKTPLFVSHRASLQSLELAA